MFRSTLVSSSPVQTSIPAASEGDAHNNQSGAPAIKHTRSLRETLAARVGSLFESKEAEKKERHFSEPIPSFKFPAPVLKQRASAPATLHADEVNPDSHLLRMIQQAVTCPIHKDVLLNLRGEPAVDTLLLMQKILDDPGEYGLEDHRYTLRRFLIRLSRESGHLPPSLFLNAVVCIDRDPFGGGSFADIFQAKHNGRPVALKRLRMFQSCTDKQKKEHVNSFFREALMWRQLSHPHILPFLGVDKVTFDGHLCMVAPFMQNGNIIQCAEYFLQIGADVPREPWLLEIGKGLQYLHKEQLVHGDLRGANILIDGDLHVRLADFGVAVLADASSSSGISTRSGGAAHWCSPEVLRGEASSFESDIYAFGCVCVELYTLTDPFAGCNDAQVVAKVLKGIRPKRPPPETGIQLYIWSLARRCWTVKASRPDIEAILDSLANQRIVPLSITPRSPPASPKRIHRHHTSTPSNATLAELAELATSDSDGHSYSLSSTPSAMSPFFPPSESLDHSPQSVDFLGHGHSRSSSPRDRSSPPRAGVLRTSGSHAVHGFPRTRQVSPGVSASSEEFEIMSSRSSFETDESNVFYPVVL